MDKSIEKNIVLTMLEKKLEDDFSFYKDGILGSMCSSPSEIASEVFSKYHEKNLGDTGLFPSSAKLEAEVISILATLLSYPEACGTILSGGTEANIMALWAAKKIAGNKKQKVVLSETAHFSFDKAASLMDLQLCRVPTNNDNSVNMEALIKSIDENTMAIVGIAGTTGLGAVDDIKAIGKIAQKQNLYFHVDAAFGGFVLPFLKDAGYKTRDFDFSIQGVSSITIDPHKMGRSVIPSGALLFREKSSLEKISTPVNYLSGGFTVHRTLIGTRNGASVAAVWAVLKEFGHEGFVDVVRECMKKTHALQTMLLEVPEVSCIVEPVMNIIGLRSSKFESSVLASQLRKRGWAVALFGNFIRIVLMPHVTINALRNFVTELKDIHRQEL